MREIPCSCCVCVILWNPSGKIARSGQQKRQRGARSLLLRPSSMIIDDQRAQDITITKQLKRHRKQNINIQTSFDGTDLSEIYLDSKCGSTACWTRPCNGSTHLFVLWHQHKELWTLLYVFETPNWCFLKH